MARVWKIAPGEYADRWEMCRDLNCILLGWRALRNYRRFKSQEAILEALGGGPGDGAGAARSIWQFANEVKPFDIVIANQGRAIAVGIGIIKSDYLPPRSQQNPSPIEWLPHARLVEWVVKDSIDLERNFFGMSTVHALSEEKVERIRSAYLTQHPSLKKTLANLFAGVDFGKPDASRTEELQIAAEEELEERRAFDPTGIRDARIKIQASIVQRRGQREFRKRLLAAYSRQSAITGCAVEDVLEAAHIVPYKGEMTNHPGNGLLLRADLHTLFDLGLIAVNDVTMRLLVSAKLNGTGYENYRGKKVRIPKQKGKQPSREALEQHRVESGFD